jgi:hypothetical protein
MEKEFKICIFCGERFFRKDHKINFNKMIICGKSGCIKEYDKQRPSHYNSETQKEYYLKNKESIKEQHKEYSQIPEIKKRHQEKNKENWKNNKEVLSLNNKKNYLENKEERLLYAQNYREENKEKVKESKRKYQKDNWDKIYAKNKIYVEENREKMQKYWTDYHRNKRNIDIEYKLRCNLAKRIRNALKNYKKSMNTMQLTGCSLIELKKHIESQFKDGMTWENYGFYGWHIDHIAPCITFELLNTEQQKQCFNYKNLQPMWGKENMSKGGKLIECKINNGQFN